MSMPVNVGSYETESKLCRCECNQGSQQVQGQPRLQTESLSLYLHSYIQSHTYKNTSGEKKHKETTTVCVYVCECACVRVRARRGIMESINVKGKSLLVTLNLEGNSTGQSTMNKCVSLSFRVKQFYTVSPEAVVSFLSEVTGIPWLVYGEYSVDLLNLQQIREFISIRTHLLKFYAQAP